MENNRGYDEGLQDMGLPVPIQIFLWRQIAPFIRPRLGKLHEAACMSFEKVLVQNIQFGLSPSLSVALQNVSRWRILQAALPHIMHCAASLLYNRVKDLQSLGAAETKLLYTLHWILLDAAEECADADMESEHGAASLQHYLFSIPTISLFVYLFAPLAYHLKESDFQNFRLENGLKLWQGLWEYRAPSAPCFNQPCKPRPRSSLKVSSSKITDVFLGRKPVGPNQDTVGADSPLSTSVSDQGPLPRSEDEGTWLSSPKESVFPETIPEEVSSTEDERVVIFRLPATSVDTPIYAADASLFQGSLKSGKPKPEETSKKIARPPMQKASSSSDKESMDSSGSSGRRSKGPLHTDSNICAATFMDIATLRCLFIPHWQEEGVYWALHYMYNRIRDISEDMVPPPQPRRRSNSLPIPFIEVSFHQGSNGHCVEESGNRSPKDFMEVPEPQIGSLLSESPYNARRCSENNEVPLRRSSEKKRRVQIADLRLFVGTRLLSKSERALEKIDTDSTDSTVKPLRLEHVEYHRSLDTGEEHLPRCGSMISRAPSTNLVKGKSMPSLRYIGETHRGYKSKCIVNFPSIPRNPIITVTEHTPAPSPDYLRNQGSMDSQMDAVSSGTVAGINWRSGMARSKTDSHISYGTIEETEVAGSSSYITREGSIDLQVVLQALYSVARRDTTCCSLRVLEALLNLTELMLEMGAMKHSIPSHSLIMGVIEKVFRHLGCPHGCGESLRGPPAEFLRTQCHAILSRIIRATPAVSKSYLRRLVRTQPLTDVLDFFHSFVGFCVDPSTLLSPLNQKRSSSKSPDLGSSAGQGGYTTNFGGEITGGTEGIIMSAVFKALVTRFVDASKEVKSPENMALHCDVRQLVTYVKGAHGGPFRRVALSGLLGVSPRPNRKGPILQTTRVIRHVHHLDSLIYPSDDRSAKKLLFKKRSTSSTCASLLETEGGEDLTRVSQSPLGNLRRKPRPTLTPRQSERALLGESGSHSCERPIRGRLSGIVNWFRRNPNARHNLADLLESPSEAGFVRQRSIQQAAGRRAGDGLGRSLQRARRRVERRLGRMGIGKGKKKTSGVEEVPGSYLSRRSSFDAGEGPRESEVVVLKERRLVQLKPIQAGMACLGLLLDTCPPGSVPDPQLLAAALDLPQSPVVARAALLLECAQFVHSCNRGQWPSWMKLNLPAFRPSGPSVVGRGPPAPGLRRTHILQRAAGKMFYQWAEALGSRLEELVALDRQTAVTVASSLGDYDCQKTLIQQDEEEDFLDEASVNPCGSDCPPVLRLVACMLLLEITAFLRETYQSLPRASRLLARERPAPWERVYREANRRWSMALSSMGHSQTSAQSLQSITGAEGGGQTERKISFVLHEPDNESEGSSNTTVTLQGEDVAQSRRPTAPPVRPFLLRRGTGGGGPCPPGGGSFKRRSLKLRRPTKEMVKQDPEPDYPVKRADSIQSKRKVSSLSDRSDTSEAGVVSGGEESPGILSDEQPPESPSDSNDTDDTGKNLPWMRATLDVLNSFNFYCGHQTFCHPHCYRRHMRAASRLVKAVRKVYGDELGLGVVSTSTAIETPRPSARSELLRGRKVSDHTNSSQTSPTKRKASVSRRDRTTDDTDSIHPRILRTIEDKEKKKDTPAVLKYIKTQVRELFHSPIATLVKGAAVMGEEHFLDSLPAAWELLLEGNQETAASAAALFILGAVKAPGAASDIMQRSLKHRDPGIRISAILRFQVLWKLRYQVWPRMEEGAHLSFKVPPPGIEFTLPSPKIGIESLPVVDPPWSPRAKTKDMEVTLNQERHRSLVTATKTRKKQQTEAIRCALMQQEAKRRAERQSFLLSTIPITVQAAHEPGLDHAPGEDHTEAPGNDEEGDGPRSSAPHLHAAHSLFPSCLCSAVVQIVGLLDDAAVSADGTAVYEVAYQVIWTCLVEDSALFLRYVLERLTRDKQDDMFKLLRHLIRFIPRLPQQAAFALYNYIIGYVMFYVRSPHEGGQQLVGTALSILWMVVHSVHGIMFKDLKQILRKEQCDASILLTANVPSAKKIIVHGPQERDEGGIPSQFPVQEDTQFFQLLRESLDFFGIDENLHKEHFLVDYKTHQIHNPLGYVRDFYFFKRSQYPQLMLVRMRPQEAFAALQHQELLRKFVEIGKVHLTWAILKNVDMVVQRVVFLHEELMKLPSFPRKALEADLDLYHGGDIGKELLGLDVLHKFMWVRLIARMFEAMAGNFAYSGDIQLFLNVLNGAALLHTEDSCILRYVMATYVNAAFNFKNIFSTNGYLLIMPTLLQIYSHHQTNKLVKTTVEYAVKQFYLMNRKPFILQMFGSVSAILDTDEESMFGDAHKVQSSCLFNLLLSLETPSPDPLNISELVKESKPLQAIDFCYHDESEMVTVLDCISLCVMVVSYSAESIRGYQMLIILEAILPCYVRQIQLPTYYREGKSERDIILQLAVAVRTLVNNCEGLSKSYNGPYRNSPEHKGSSQRNCSRGPPCSPGLDFEDESHSKYVSDMGRSKGGILDVGAEDSELVRSEYRRPRDVLLSLVGEFMSRAAARLAELSRKQNISDGKPVDLLDIRSHVRLADIAHSLLKVSPYDPESMACRGLQRYMSCVLPRAEWSDDAMRAALFTILRRLDKVFLKISKKPSIRRNTDWEAAAGLLKGIHETILRYPYVMHWQYVRALLNTCQVLIVSEPGAMPEGVSSAGAAVMSQPPPPHFCSTVVRLVALQVVSPGDFYSLEQVCGGNADFPSQEKAEGALMNLLIPLCLRVGSGRGDVAELRQGDISFLVTAVLHAMSPPGKTGGMGSQGTRSGVDTRAGSLTFTGSREAKRPARVPGSLYQAAFLALRVLCVCFEPRLAGEWPRVARVMRDLGRRNEAAPELWGFLEFVVTHRTPLYILLQPFILHKISQPPIGDYERHMQFLIRERMRGTAPSGGLRSRGALLLELARELRDLKDELDERRYVHEVPETSKRPADALTTGPNASDGGGRHQRPSLISLLTGAEHRTGQCTPSDTLSQSLPPPRESLSSNSTGNPPGQVSINECQSSYAPEKTNQQESTSSCQPFTAATSHSNGHTAVVSHLSHSLSHQLTRTQAPKLRFVSSVEFRHSSGETSTTPLSPDSAAEDSSGESQKPRLQRSKAQSRKTFRLRRGRQNHCEIGHSPLESDTVNTRIDLSWDSVSQTSSTSGYRDNGSLQGALISPEGSLNGERKAGSRHSLLMVFETQDEDTLI